jgi:hypothetical protein
LAEPPETGYNLTEGTLDSNFDNPMDPGVQRTLEEASAPEIRGTLEAPFQLVTDPNWQELAPDAGPSIDSTAIAPDPMGAPVAPTGPIQAS